MDLLDKSLLTIAREYHAAMIRHHALAQRYANGEISFEVVKQSRLECKRLMAAFQVTKESRFLT